MTDTGQSTPPEDDNPVADNAKVRVDPIPGKPSQAEGDEGDSNDVE